MCIGMTTGQVEIECTGKDAYWYVHDYCFDWNITNVTVCYLKDNQLFIPRNEEDFIDGLYYFAFSCPLAGIKSAQREIKNTMRKRKLKAFK